MMMRHLATTRAETVPAGRAGRRQGRMFSMNTKEARPVSAGPANSKWIVEMIASLRVLWEEGHSAAEIGRRLGVSKSAVIGKVHRLNLPGRPSPLKGGGANDRPLLSRRAQVPKLAGFAPIAASPRSPPAAAASAPIVPPPSLPVAFTRTTASSTPRRCCWPIGHPGTPAFRFCDEPARVARPYCDEHARRAYRHLGEPADQVPPGVAAGKP